MGASVVTETAMDDGLVALTFKLEGITVHVAPVGAPVHVMEACPANPAPPMESVYFAVPPAVTVADPDEPDGRAKPMLGTPTATPVSATDCGLPVALSVTIKVAEAFPTADGLNVMLIVQFVRG